ncbi:hypothetical protein BpHYR1_049800 [Brachionus plicatilis]|uniref:Uncharacterized protein n=1 Tax=Brachionus plicatilis TaxID=10195 RepID=A0A3M7RLD9_BRAPC|nr:hypothetical protein BpHYR1_049800 [Brachionus plicatilis]
MDIGSISTQYLDRLILEIKKKIVNWGHSLDIQKPLKNENNHKSYQKVKINFYLQMILKGIHLMQSLVNGSKMKAQNFKIINQIQLIKALF